MGVAQGNQRPKQPYPVQHLVIRVLHRIRDQHRVDSTDTAEENHSSVQSKLRSCQLVPGRHAAAGK